MVLKNTLLFAVLIFAGFSSYSQNAVIKINTSFLRTETKFDRTEDTLKKQFEAKQLAFPPKEIYIRSFKYERILEVWVKNDVKQPFKLFKTYPICMESGTIGPKRMEGDYQVPEGFYYINEFNPNSNYHLALGLNYPNTSDKILSDSLHVSPGGNIYIHGDCVSTGCLPIMDGPIEEVYMLATYAKAQGQDFIPVHVFPVKYNIKKSFDFLTEINKENKALQHFDTTLKDAFDYFELHKQLPIIMTDKSGKYVVSR